MQPTARPAQTVLKVIFSPPSHVQSFFFSSRRRHTRYWRDWSSDVCSSDLDSEIVGVHFRDGATVKKGDLLFTLDSRALEAQVRQADGNVARDQAQLDGAERDVRRYTDLVAKNATPVVNLDNAKTQAETFRANLI